MIIFLLISTTFLLDLFLKVNVYTAILNIALLFSSIYFYLSVSNMRINSIKNPLFILLAGIPLFTHHIDTPFILLAIGLTILLIAFLKSKSNKFFGIIIFLYIGFASLYVSGLIKFPFLFQRNLFITSDNFQSLYIAQMRSEALYLPYQLRRLIFNQSIFLYVALSKMAGLFALKNFYDVLLIANLYPMITGIVLDIKSWNHSRAFIIFSVLVASFVMVFSRSVNIFNDFILFAPFIVYYIFRGFESTNKKIYLLLFILSLIVVTSP